jgi:phage gp36-like protein
VDTWITITQDDVLASINNAELTAALTVQLAPAQPSPLLKLIPDVTEFVRGYCRVRNTLGLAGTLPQELKNPAIDIIIYRVAKRVRKSAVAKEAKPDADDAMETLKAVASGNFAISAPTVATDTISGGSSPAVETPHRRFGYDEERGI